MSEEGLVETANALETFSYFETPVYITKQPQFIDIVRETSLRSLAENGGDIGVDALYPLRMSGNLIDHPDLEDFSRFIGETTWNILSSQGYDMSGHSTFFTEMWCQEHFRTSSMEYHVHPDGSYIIGFYFLDVPEGSPKAVIHDPRPGRTMLDLPQQNVSQASLASTMINFTPEPGMLLFSPSWLPHSFGRHGSVDPFRFIHFNVSARPIEQEPAEII